MTQEALVQLESSTAPTSGILQRAIRLARLRNDFDHLWEFDLEMVVTGTGATRDIEGEVRAHYSAAQFRERRTEIMTRYLRDRTLPRHLAGDAAGPQCLVLAVSGIEHGIGSVEEEIRRMVPPAGLQGKDLYRADLDCTRTRAQLAALAAGHRQILDRIRARIHRYLSRCETELLNGQLQSGIFEEQRRYVYLRLAELAPDAAQQLQAASERVADGQSEGRAHALLSCRRALETMADRLYPPRSTPVEGKDGKSRVLTQTKFIARLHQFAHESVGNRTSGKLLLVQIEDLGHRLDSAHELANKGLHSTVSATEAGQCVIQTFLLVADLLRLYEQDSGLLVEDSENRHHENVRRGGSVVNGR